MERFTTPTGLHGGRGGQPDGPPVLFVHGAMDRGAAFLRATRLVPELSWWVYDRRGYGRSVGMAAASFDDHVADVLDLVALVQAQADRPAVLVGHSLGGTLALAAAHRDRAGAVAAVVTYEAPLSWLDWWPHRGPEGPPLEEDEPAVAAERFMRRVAGEQVWASLPEATRRRRREEGVALVAELATVRLRPAFVAAEITVPVVVARGGPADDVRVRAADLLVAELPAGELAVLDDAPHGAHTSRPAAFAGLVRRGVERAAAPAGGAPVGGASPGGRL